MSEDFSRKVLQLRIACDEVLKSCATPPRLALTLEAIEREAILSALAQFRGKHKPTARQLDIGLRTLGTKVRRYRLGGFMGAEAQKSAAAREERRKEREA